MDEIVPGILHWTAFHDGIGQTVHSYVHTPSGAIFDPRLPDGPATGPDVLAPAIVAAVVLLSNRHHLRNATDIAEAYDVPIRVSRAGADELGADVEPFDPGDIVAEGVTAFGLPALTPEEVAFRIESSDPETPAALRFADTLAHHDGELTYMPDQLLGDDPAAVRAAMTEQLRDLLDSAAPFDALLFAHGNPVPEGGAELLRAFVAAQSD